MKSFTSLIITALAILMVPALLCAAEAKKDDLRKRIRERAPKIEALKDKGVIGETDEGYVDFVKGKDAEASAVVDPENADRKTVYNIIAKDTGESVDKVARQAAQKRFDHAKPGEWMKISGTWKKKA